MSESEYPEVEKYLDEEDRFNAFKSFLEWMTMQQGYVICREDPSVGKYENGWYPAEKTNMQLVADYLGIDLIVFERERAEILRAAIDSLKQKRG